MDFYNVLLAKKTNKVLQFGNLYDRLFETWINRARQILKDLPTGAISTVNDATPLPLNALKVSVEAWQEGSGDPSPSNVRPIHGWDSAEIGVVGKNWLPLTISDLKALNSVGTWNGNEYTANGIVFKTNTDTNGAVIGIEVNGTASNDFSFVLGGANFLRVGKNYIFTSGNQNASTSTYFINIAGIGSDGQQISFTAPQDMAFPRIYIRNGASISNQTFYPMIRLATEADSTFEPYQGKQYTQQFSQTIYGAEWDVVGGKLTKTPKNGFVIFGDLVWKNMDTNISGVYRKRAALPVQAKPVANNQIFNAMCSAYASKSANDTYLCVDGVISGDNTGSYIYVYDSRFPNSDDLTDFVNAVATTQLLYELNTPPSETINLSPLSIRLLEGVNNLYADCGEVLSGKYWANV